MRACADRGIETSCVAQGCKATSGSPCCQTSGPDFQVACPKCGAGPGRRCIDLSMSVRCTFHTRVPHAERQRLGNGQLTVTVQLTAAQMALRAPKVGVCSLCGQPFAPPTNGRPALFCSTYCRTKAWRIANPARSKRQPWRSKRY